MSKKKQMKGKARLHSKKKTKRVVKKRTIPLFITEACNRLFSHMYTETAFNSCGVTEIDGVSYAFRTTYLGLKSDKNKEDFLKYLEENFSKELNNHCSGAFKTISLPTKTNNDESNFGTLYPKERIEAILDKNATFKSESRLNTNSGNEIKIWVF